MQNDDKFVQLYKELVQVVNEIQPYYDIDKIKWYSVYIWTKENNNDLGENVFDIQENKIIFYVENHTIIEEVKPIIIKIQEKLKELSLYTKNSKLMI